MSLCVFVSFMRFNRIEFFLGKLTNVLGVNQMREELIYHNNNKYASLGKNELQNCNENEQKRIK